MQQSQRSAVAAVVAFVLALSGALTLVTAPAVAGPVDAPWQASGTGQTTVVSDGSAAAAQMTYNGDGNSSGEWLFTTTATGAALDGPLKVPYTWQGLHAWFAVTARMDLVVQDQGQSTWRTVGTPVDPPRQNCCTSPSNGFLYSGTAVFDSYADLIDPGDRYGFRLSGSNGDYNQYLRGTLTLSSKPYLDATIGKDNRQWNGAEPLTTAGDTGTLDEAGEARWWKIDVTPGQKVTVDLSQLPADYDVALYGDIGAAFDQLQQSSAVTELAASSATAAPGSGSDVPEYADIVSQVPKTAADLPTASFAPRIYAPRIYAPRIYAPRIYAPRIYAPRIYAPRIYADGAFDPDQQTDAAFRDAFTGAQNQTLLAVSANTGTDAETVSASTGNTAGDFYVRVQGHNDKVFDAQSPFRLGLSVSGGAACVGVKPSPVPATPAAATDGAPETVVVTDTNKLGLAAGSADQTAYLASLGRLAAATRGVVLDVATDAKVRALRTQLAGHPDCPYAANLVAEAIRDRVSSYRGAGTKYVVIAGADDVVPFFRYPDTSGLGQESQFSPPMQDNSPSGASLSKDQVLGQDAYGSATEITIGGTTLPVPELAVGRLVKTPQEIESQVASYLQLQDGTLPAPRSSLVTGYDFLADAAHAVSDELGRAVGTPPEQLIAENGADRATSWTGSDLKKALLDQPEDVVFLAGHFSANDTLAADFATTFEADDLAPDGPYADRLRDKLVLSVGCHSGYSIVDGESVPTKTNTADWSQRMAQQGAVLIGGTGYQYGDTEFLEYSERLYLQVTKRLAQEAGASGDAPVPVGAALAEAKQDYLAGLTTLSGIDQKAVLQATLYGLPMTGFDAPHRSSLAESGAGVSPTAVTSGPGSQLGLQTSPLDVPIASAPEQKTATQAGGSPVTLSWREGDDGVSTQPGLPTLPKKVLDVTDRSSGPEKILRGVGFRSGRYSDKQGVLPLTGAPAIEGDTPHSTFDSPAFFPQKLTSVNYFGKLGRSGRTSLVLNPLQYRTESSTTYTATERSYRDLGLQLYYSGTDNDPYGTGDNAPALAAAPSLGGVSATLSGGQVTFSVRATGDPSAGVQQVWVTWTGSPGDSGYGEWRSIDLVQDPDDSTLWKASWSLPPGQSRAGIRFLVQAVNGVGAVGLDTADGDGYQVSEAGADTATLGQLRSVAPTTAAPLGVVARATDADGGRLEGRRVRFTFSRPGATTPLFTADAPSGADGDAVPTLPTGQLQPGGRLTVTAQVLGSSSEQPVGQSRSLEVVLPGTTATVTPGGLVGLASKPITPSPKVVLTDARGPVAGSRVTFTLPTGAVGATFPGATRTATVTTGPDGSATAPALTALAVPGIFTVAVGAEGAASTVRVPVAAQYVLNPAVSAPASTRLDGTTLTALVKAKRVQVRWRLSTTGSPWLGARTDLSADLFKELLKGKANGPELGLAKGKTYVVQVRVLPAATDPRPVGDTDRDGTFDLGSISFTLAVR